MRFRVTSQAHLTISLCVYKLFTTFLLDEIVLIVLYKKINQVFSVTCQISKTSLNVYLNF